MNSTIFAGPRAPTCLWRWSLVLVSGVGLWRSLALVLVVSGVGLWWSLALVFGGLWRWHCHNFALAWKLCAACNAVRSWRSPCSQATRAFLLVHGMQGTSCFEVLTCHVELFFCGVRRIICQRSWDTHHLDHPGLCCPKVRSLKVLILLITAFTS